MKGARSYNSTRLWLNRSQSGFLVFIPCSAEF